VAGPSAAPAAAGGGTQVTVSTASGCTWTAASNVSWVAVAPASGAGTGTVIATVAANTSTSPRTGILTVAGRTFTINQAGAAGAAAPATPTGPSPAAGATSVSTTPTLIWSSSGATAYSVAFGTSNPPATAASGLTTASYRPATLTAGVTYYWRVTATNGGGSTTGPVWSFTTAAGTAPPVSTLPSPWQNKDVGTVGLAGSASVSGSVFTVSGSGADIWGTADGFQFVSQPVTGNVEIVVRLTSEQNTSQYAKAGVMLRESLAANAAHVILDVKPGGGVELLKRSAAGVTTTSLASATQAPPAWLRLARVGSTVSAAVSADGSTWRSVGSTTVTMSSAGYVGLAVTSHNQAARNTATFDKVAVTPLGATGLPAGWANQDIGDTRSLGSTTHAAGKFTVIGSGADIWGTADSFHFASRTLTGDGQIVARLTSEQNTNTYAKAGVMIRAGRAAGDAMVILDIRPGGGVEFMKRASAGGSVSFVAGATQALPGWLRLVRSGSTVTASVSADGVTWRTVGSTTATFGTSVYVGLAVTSHSPGSRNTCTFDNVAVR
jgi:regulation of enolase protein 1 (concanavalin A-like superfamily)